MANSADPDQLALKPTDLDLHFLQRQGISRFSRTRIKLYQDDRRVTMCFEVLYSHKLNPISRGI